MANPQAENGHIDIANEIVERFASLQLSGNQWRLLWVILRQTYGWKKKTDRISITLFEKRTGLDRRHIHRALKDMFDRKIIAKNATTFIASYGFNKNYSQWELLPKMSDDKNGNASLPKMATKPLPKLAPTKEKKETTQKKGPVDPAILSLFNSFYQAYPKHEDREGALKSFLKVNPQNGQFEAILQAIERRKDYNDHLRRQDPKAFIPEWPLPSTWLNRKRWEDEIPEVPSAAPGQKDSSCPRCGAQIPPQDRTGEGCIHCANKAAEARA